MTPLHSEAGHLMDLRSISRQRAEGPAKTYPSRELALARAIMIDRELINLGALKPHKYEIIVSWYADDGIFVAEVPELPGCTAHGVTPAAAVTHAQEAIDLWLDVARENGDPIPRPRAGRSLHA